MMDFAAGERATQLDDALDVALSVFFYWVNFGPLSRGSAACGYAILVAVLAALNVEITITSDDVVDDDDTAVARSTKGSAKIKGGAKFKGNSSGSGSGQHWLPRGVQLDWEAILRPTPRAFIAEVKPKLRPRLRPLPPSADLLAAVPLLDDALPTLRDALAALNAGSA